MTEELETPLGRAPTLLPLLIIRSEELRFA